MDYRVFLVVAGLLANGSLLGACTPSSSPPVALRGSLQGAESALAGEVEGVFVIAVVYGIDYAKGLIDLETEVGRFFASGTPEDIQQLQKGDVILVYIDRDEEPPMLHTPLPVSSDHPPLLLHFAYDGKAET